MVNVAQMAVVVATTNVVRSHGLTHMDDGENQSWTTQEGVVAAQRWTGVHFRMAKQGSHRAAEAGV
jgi:hypothetical protein